MAFSRATGKHRRPGRIARSTVRAASVAALTASGIIGSLAATPALAADGPSGETGLSRAIDLSAAMADRISAQAAAQQQAAQAAALRDQAEERAARQAEASKRKAEAQAKKRRQAKERAARAAARKRLNTYVAPVAGAYVTTGYRTGGALWSSGTHTGIDFHAASGTPVRAVGSGTVVEAGWGGAFGNNVVIKMHDGTYTQYGHLSSIGVSVGQSVTPGQHIALSGATGNVTGPHLHFEARTTPDYGSDINPLSYLRAHGVGV